MTILCTSRNVARALVQRISPLLLVVFARCPIILLHKHFYVVICYMALGEHRCSLNHKARLHHFVLFVLCIKQFLYLLLILGVIPRLCE